MNFLSDAGSFFIRKKDRTDPSACSMIVVRLVFEQIARLAVKHLADLIESGKADRVDLIVFYFGQVGLRDADLFGQILQRHFAFDHDPVKSEDDHILFLRSDHRHRSAD